MPTPVAPTPPPGYRLVRDTGGKRGRPPLYGPAPDGARHRTLPPLSDQEWAAVQSLVRSMRAANSQ